MSHVQHLRAALVAEHLVPRMSQSMPSLIPPPVLGGDKLFEYVVRGLKLLGQRFRSRQCGSSRSTYSATALNRAGPVSFR